MSSGGSANVFGVGEHHRPDFVDRFLLQITVGAMPHDKVMRSIELFGTEVAPAVRAEVAGRTAAPAESAAGTAA